MIHIFFREINFFFRKFSFYFCIIKIIFFIFLYLHYFQRYKYGRHSQNVCKEIEFLQQNSNPFIFAIQCVIPEIDLPKY